MIKYLVGLVGLRFIIEGVYCDKVLCSLMKNKVFFLICIYNWALLTWYQLCKNILNNFYCVGYLHYCFCYIFF